MKTGEKELRELGKSTAESFASLSIGLWTVSLIGYLTSGISWATYFLGIIGIISALLGTYLILPWNWRQKLVLEFLENKKRRMAKLLIWLIVIATFGVGLIQTKVIWLIFTGLITMTIAVVVFYVGLFRMNKD
ncbi:hypothetical protein ACFLWZ_03255 [Chloroflexota bacterium]